MFNFVDANHLAAKKNLWKERDNISQSVAKLGARGQATRRGIPSFKTLWVLNESNAN